MMWDNDLGQIENGIVRNLIAPRDLHLPNSFYR